jgi:hypothetical protein
MATALRQGTTVAQEASRLAVELTRIAWGLSDVAPAKGDRRFTDPAWTSNPVFRMIQQTYLASAQALDRIVTQLGEGASGTKAEQARFAANIMTSAAAMRKVNHVWRSACLLAQRVQQPVEVLTARAACLQVRGDAEVALLSRLARSHQHGIHVQHLHGLGASYVARIGPQETVQFRPPVHERPTVS